jgi:nucleobase:cation symporter-1, NCS1 family
MAAVDEKNYYVERNGSPLAERAETGQVSGLKRRFLHFNLEVRQEESSFAVSKNASNADFDPIPPSKRTWTW